MEESIDDALFQRIMYNPYHVIHHLLPARRELVYTIRQRYHDRQLTLLFPVSCVTETSYIVCSSKTVIDSLISVDYAVLFSDIYRYL